MNMREHRYRWDRPHATVRDTRGPERVEVGEEDPGFVRRAVGFTAAVEDVVEVEPKLWDGED